MNCYYRLGIMSSCEKSVPLQTLTPPKHKNADDVERQEVFIASCFMAESNFKTKNDFISI